VEPIVTTYLVYITISVALTVWVGRTLSRNGHVFLLDVFARPREQLPVQDAPREGADDRAKLATSVNHLLVVGFYLLNLGYVTLALKIGGDVPDVRTAIESLSTKLGGVLLVLGTLHLGNVYVLSRVRRRKQLERAPRPLVPPSAWAPPMHGYPAPPPPA
jgi:hypothetical protein